MGIHHAVNVAVAAATVIIRAADVARILKAKAARTVLSKDIRPWPPRKRLLLLARVGQLGSAVGELDAAGIELEDAARAAGRRRAAPRRPRAADSGRAARRDRGPDWARCARTRTRLKTSDQVSSPATWMPAAMAALAKPSRLGSAVAERGQQIDAGMALETRRLTLSRSGLA